MNSSTDDLRALATTSLKKKAAFKSYLFVWGVVSALLVVIWFLASPGALFWPGFGIAGMVIALVATIALVVKGVYDGPGAAVDAATCSTAAHTSAAVTPVAAGRCTTAAVHPA